ncbi:MAG: extracellular solute-binding protein [Verrucomicrobiota bacterium]|nr:extracellular solute-binding protein [Verrucomicrobiota bacterium]
MARIITIFFAFACILGLPFVFKKEQRIIRNPDATVIIVSPHTESIRTEFAHGFREWYRARTGKEVYIDYRNVGGTSEILKYLDSQYANNFKNYWTGTLKRAWNEDVQAGFGNSKVTLDATPEDDTLAEAARRAFLSSDVTCGIDVFFGGGSYDFVRQKGRGQFIDSDVLKNHPEYFGEYPSGIPLTFAGEPFYDKDGLWFGTVLSSFGIIYNRVCLQNLGVEKEPSQWEDLANPMLYGQVSLADPTKSGSANKAFEMIVQVCILRELKKTPQDEKGAIRRGWITAMQLTQQISGNARYFTDSSQKPNIDIAMGDCAAGMSIDFYGRFQGEVLEKRSGEARFNYITPLGASTVSVDPMALMRGAPNSETAKLFMEYVMSPSGQALWNLKVGAQATVTLPNGQKESVKGPVQFTLRRPPTSPLYYTAEFADLRTDPTVNPYLDAGDFRYHAEWTSHLFTERALIIRVAFIDLHPELKQAWKALIDNGFPPEAMAKFSDMSVISYDETQGEIKKALGNKDKIAVVQFTRELSKHFREQYLEAERLAKAKR